MNILEMLPHLKAGKIIRMADKAGNYIKFLIRGEGPPIGKKSVNAAFFYANLHQVDYQPDAPELDLLRFETLYEIEVDEIEYSFTIVSPQEALAEFTARWLEKAQSRKETRADH